MNTKICLVIIFNHQFNQNLPILRTLYSGRFSFVRFIVPFYSGTDEDVISVASSSVVFQAYINQAEKKLAGGEFSHYVFVADDMLLNPKINEENILSILRVEANEAYIKELRPITSVTFNWTYLYSVLKACKSTYAAHASQLPSRQEAFERLAAHGVRVTTFGFKNLRFGESSLWFQIRSLLIESLFLARFKEVRRVIYPLAMGYSDLVIVPASSFGKFSYLCGVFASMKVFVECAMPTALALSVSRIRLEDEIDLKGIELFNQDELEKFKQSYNLHLNTLMDNFPDGSLYIHPIKLSQWCRE